MIRLSESDPILLSRIILPVASFVELKAETYIPIPAFLIKLF